MATFPHTKLRFHDESCFLVLIYVFPFVLSQGVQHVVATHVRVNINGIHGGQACQHVLIVLSSSSYQVYY